jgi:hypothetical protein
MAFHGLGGCGGTPEEEAIRSQLTAATTTTQASAGGTTTLTFQAPGQPFQATVANVQTSRTVSVFYPTGGQGQNGLCWQGLTIDRANNVYPVASGEFVKIKPNGVVVNGANDTGFFATGGLSFWGTLDEKNKKLFTAVADTVRSAPFMEFSEFSQLVAGLAGNAQAVAVGKGPLAGSVLVTDTAAPGVFRVTLKPLAVKLLASGAPFTSPEAIASASNGTLYVVNAGSNPATLVKVTPKGVASVFATSTDTDGRRMVAVDDEGTVFWSKATGIDRFKPNGTGLTALPGPNDQATFGNPMGSAFDSRHSLYVVDNSGCKKIYKYTEH